MPVSTLLRARYGRCASAIRETGKQLKGVGPLADVAGQAADGVDKVAQFFEGKQVGDVFRDVERFARREPAIFIGAAFAVGLIGGRFLKTSARSRDEHDIDIAGVPTQRMSQPPAYGRQQGFGQGPRAAIRPVPKRYSAEPSHKASESSSSPSASSSSSSSQLGNGVSSGGGSLGGI